MGQYFYRLAGLRIVSDAPLDGLPELAGGTSPPFDVSIERVELDELRRQAAQIPEHRKVWFDAPRGGAFMTCEGGRIVYAPLAQARPRRVFTCLTGTCLPAAAYMQGLLPLHSGVVDTALGCVGFLGRSGQGKSTLAAAFAGPEQPLFTDDVCFVSVGDEDRPMVWPGVGWMKLGDASAAATGYAARSPADDPGNRKRRVRLPGPLQAQGPRPWRAIYLLDEAEPGEAASMVPLNGAEAASTIIANAHRFWAAAKLGRTAQAVGVAVAIAEACPVFRFQRRMGLEHLAETAAFVHEHLAGLDG